MITATKDILIYESGNGGDLAVMNNDIALGELLLQQVYLCLFGGNLEADTKGNELSTEIRQDWWANSLFFALDASRQLNSQTERALYSNALNSTGRVNIERAVAADLVFFKNFADLAVSVSILSESRVQISVTMTQPGNEQGSTLQLIWDGAKGDVAVVKVV